MNRTCVSLFLACLATAALGATGCGGAYGGPSGPGVTGSSAASLVDDAYRDRGLLTSLGVGRAAYASRSLAYDTAIDDTIPMNVGSVSGALDAGGSSLYSMLDNDIGDDPFDSVSTGGSLDVFDDGSASPLLTSLENDMAFDSDTADGCNGDESATYDAGGTGIPEVDDAMAEEDAAFDAGGDLADPGTTC